MVTNNVLPGKNRFPPQRRGGKALNITRRGGIYYFRKVVEGKRRRVSLNTADRALALARAKALARAAVAGKWAALDGTTAKRGLASTGQVFAALRGGAIGLGIKAATVEGYIRQLGNIGRQVLGATVSIEGLGTDVWTEELVLRYQERVLTATPEAGRERAQRTIRSTVTNARAVFGRRTARLYQGLSLPASLQGFLTVALNRSLVRSYRLPPADLLEGTLRAARNLYHGATGPRHWAWYLCFLLTHDLGLRAGEAAAAQWSWFAAGQRVDAPRVVEILRRPDFTPKWNKERRVPVSDAVWTHLQVCRAALAFQMPEYGEFVLPGRDRRGLVTRDFAGWIRSLGWDRSEYPKAAHELRKLMGSRWYSELGAEVAQAWLGHQNVATTCSFYAALTQQPPPLRMEGDGKRPRQETI